jgi:hypothetical protein
LFFILMNFLIIAYCRSLKVIALLVLNAIRMFKMILGLLGISRSRLEIERAHKLAKIWAGMHSSSILGEKVETSKEQANQTQM